jgi:hypothetical protein
MNNRFAEYTTSTAFSLSLTKNQCNALLRLKAGNKTEFGGISLELHTVGTMRQLEVRGLVAWAYKDGKASHFEGLTDAGRLVVGLLEQAGLTIENTNTLSILRRVA